MTLIATEHINPNTTNIDTLSTQDVLAKINAEDQTVALAVARALPQLTVVVDHTVAALQNGGRLFYIGAGTSGRLGVLDASECPPTFSTPPDLVQGIIAGGEAALRNPVEGAEDDPIAGKHAIMDYGVQSGDVVIGISASGGAPYVTAAIAYAKELGCFTAGITCVENSPLAITAHQGVVTPVGPEVIAGSTRLKAGTAQKLVLNMITTATMIQLGKTYGNLMVDVRPTNIKLVGRAERIVSELAKVSIEEAKALLSQTNYEVKPAVVMHHFSCSVEEAQQRLTMMGGKLKASLHTITAGSV